MKPPCREDSPPVVKREEDDPVFVETKTGSWEDRQRGRSFKESPKILFGAWCLLIFWLSVPLLVTSLVMKSRGYHQPWGALCVWSLVVLALSLTASLAVSLTVRCPLCHGTPLHSRYGCHKHRLSNHWFPLTRRATVVLRILTTLSFRCMSCGTPFRLFKRSSRERQ